MGRLKQDKKDEIKRNIDSAHERLNTTYDVVKSDLTFESGNQYTSEQTLARGDSRPSNVVNMCKRVKKRIVNPTKQTPYRAEIHLKDEKIVNESALQKKLQDLLDSTINSHKGREAIDTAFSTQVVAGYGGFGIGVEYTDNESMDQKLVLKRKIDPTSVYTSRFEEIDGSDMRYFFEHDRIDNDVAKELYGDDSIITEGDWSESLFSKWDYEENTTPEMVYYYKDPYKVTRVFDSNGGFRDLEKGEKLPSPLPEEFQKRVITKYKIKFCHIVGSELVEEGELPGETLPWFPCLGELNYSDDKICYTGFISLVRDVQTSINFIKSSEDENIANTPISQWLMAAGQAESNPEDWAESNYSPKILTYDLVSDPKTGAVITTPPQRVDNTVQTQSLIMSRQENISLMMEMLGMPPVAWGQVEGAQQSGASVISRQNMAEISQFDHQDNLEKTLMQASKYCVEMGMDIQTKPFELEYNGVKKMVTWDQLNIKPEDYEIKVAQGPRAMTQKEEKISKTIEAAQLNPNGIGIIWDMILEAAGNEEMAKRVRKTMDPAILEKERGGSGIDPEAQAALNEAGQTVEQYKQLSEAQAMKLEEQVQIMQSMALELQNKEADRKKDIIVEEMQSETDIKEAEIRANAQRDVEAMKQGGAMSREQLKIGTDIAKIADEGKKEVETEVAFDTEVE